MIVELAHSAATVGPAAGVAARVVLAATDPTVDDNSDDESKKSGPIGLVVIIVLCVACYFLFKSLSKHLRQVRDGAVPVSASAPGRPAAPTPGSPPAETDAGGDTESGAVDAPAAPPP